MGSPKSLAKRMSGGLPAAANAPCDIGAYLAGNPCSF